MADVGEFITDFLQHEYDPVKAREYYLRTRKLKGRKTAAGEYREKWHRSQAIKKKQAAQQNPRSKLDYNGKPLKPLGKRIEEDETPDVSPSGAKLVDYDGKGLGKATYADGSVYDPTVGWKRGGVAAVASARDANNAQRAKSGLKPLPKVNARRRIGAAEQRIIRAKSAANNIDNPNKRAAALRRISSAEKKLKATIAKNAPMRRGLRE